MYRVQFEALCLKQDVENLEKAQKRVTKNDYFRKWVLGGKAKEVWIISHEEKYCGRWGDREESVNMVDFI